MPRGYTRYQTSKKYSYYNGSSWSEYSSGLAADAAEQRDMEAWALRHPRPEVPESVPEPPRPAGEYPLWMWGPKERSIGSRNFSNLKGERLEMVTTIADLFDELNGDISIKEIAALTGGSIGPRNRVYIPDMDLAVQRFGTNRAVSIELTVIATKGHGIFYTRSIDI